MISQREASAAFVVLNTLFGKLYQAGAMPPFLQLATRVPSKGLDTTYPFAGAGGKMHEWRGEKVIKGMELNEFTVRNVPFEYTFAVPKLYIQTNTLESTNISVSDAADAALWWGVQELLELLAAGETSAATCYDGQPLFSASHSEGKSGTQTNIIASGSGVTAANLATDLAAVTVKMYSFKNDQGNPMFLSGPDTVVIPPSGPIYDGFGVLVDGLQAEGVAKWSHKLKNVLIDPTLTDTNDWYAFNTTANLKAFLFQRLQEPTTGFENPFRDTNVYFGVEAAGKMAPGNWRCAVKVKNT